MTWHKECFKHATGTRKLHIGRANAQYEKETVSRAGSSSIPEGSLTDTCIPNKKLTLYYNDELCFFFNKAGNKMHYLLKVGTGNEALPGGGYQFPYSHEINWLVPLFPRNRKFVSYGPCSPILSLFPCPPKNLAFVPVFP